MYFSPILDWVKHNLLTINWDKTKFMFLDSKNISEKIPKYISIDKNKVEIVNEFKLLGVTLDSKLSFSHFAKQLAKSVYAKLFSFKKLFYLNEETKIQFFKTFILPHFDYCLSLVVYFPKSILNQIETLYNNCLYQLLKISLKDYILLDQINLLKKHNIMPYKARIFYRLSLFSYKIVNNHFLHDINLTLVRDSQEGSQRYNTRNWSKSQADKALSSQNSYFYREAKTKNFFRSCLTTAIPMLINKVLKDSIFTIFKNFKIFLTNNFIILFCIFEEKFLLSNDIY
jgi:hypothetical protein